MDEALKINTAYLKERTLVSARQVFLNNTPQSIQLQQFLDKKSYETIRTKINKARWKKKKVLDKYRYEIAPLPRELVSFLHSRRFLMFISFITNADVTGVHVELSRFGHRSYTLLHDEQIQQKGVAFELDFTPSWNNNAGGQTVFVKNGEDVLRIAPSSNTLSVVLQNGEQSFVKYVNHFAGRGMRTMVRGCLRTHR